MLFQLFYNEQPYVLSIYFKRKCIKILFQTYQFICSISC